MFISIKKDSTVSKLILLGWQMEIIIWSEIILKKLSGVKKW
jgi:hypothetical protein